jgi:hypothetical protein
VICHRDQLRRASVQQQVHVVVGGRVAGGEAVCVDALVVVGEDGPLPPYSLMVLLG